ncbi:MAG: hypothetical protein HY556_01030 [Euryarchaeota archaeon]|nr:hypothetical protein [Euryarchaeota archaeon]
MPSFVIHATIPALVMLASRRFDWRKVLALLPLTFLCDIDYFLGIHRASLHNVFILAAVAVPIYLIDSGRLQRHAHLRENFYIASIYVASHLIMDSFAGGIVPFYPIFNQTLFIDVSVIVDTRTNTPIVDVAPGTFDGPPTVSTFYEFLNGSEAAILVFVAISILALVVFKRGSVVERHVVLRPLEKE